MKKTMSMFLLVAVMVAMVLSFSSVAFAESTQGQTFSTEGLGQTSSTTTNGQINKVQVTTDPNVNGGVPTVSLPNVQIDQAQKFVERKGFEVIGLLQKFVQPFAIFIFIICAMMAGVGTFGNSSLVGKGIWGMVIAVLIYAIVLSAPELLDFMNAWLHS